MMKRKPIRSKAIRQSAKGESCAICGIQNDTVVFCHLNEGFAGKGMGQKADDFGFYGCGLCHGAYDGKDGISHMLKDWEILRACYRTWRRQIETGVIKIKP